MPLIDHRDIARQHRTKLLQSVACAVRPGDTITGRVEVTSARTDKPITALRTTVTRDDGTVVLDGTAVCYTMEITTGNAQ